MKLYDGHSNIDWFYYGDMSIDEMRDNQKFNTLAYEPCVLYDNGDGKVYDFETLGNALSKYGLEMQDDAQYSYDRLVEFINTTEQTMPSLDERMDDVEAAVCELYEMMEG